MAKSKYEGAKIEILAWDKFNPRRDVKSPTWFRVSHSLFEEPKFYCLTGTDWAVFLYLLCEASKNNKDSFSIDFGHAERVGQLKVQWIESVLAKLEEKGFISINIPDAVAHVTCTNVDVTSVALTDGRTDGRDGGARTRTGTPKEPLHPLAEIWNSNRGPLPAVKGCDGSRLKDAKERWAENPSPEYWVEVVTTMTRSAFLRGERRSQTHPNWKADFDFMVKKGRHFLILEGKYDDAHTLHVVETSTEESERAHAESLRQAGLRA